jgi:DNA-binding transcriptional regulator/RsmH inhibitor MraZ
MGSIGKLWEIMGMRRESYMLGEFETTVESTGRVTVPPQLLKGLGRQFFIAGLPQWKHIVMFPPSAWATFIAELTSTSSPVDPKFIRMQPLLGSLSSMASVDSKRRFVIPPKLRSYVSGPAVLVGAMNTARLYSAQVWDSMKNQELDSKLF